MRRVVALETEQRHGVMEDAVGQLSVIPILLLDAKTADSSTGGGEGDAGSLLTLFSACTCVCF